MKTLPQELNDYVVSIYQELHQYPELGFDLPKTVAVVKRELDAMGIPYSTQYGKCSLVATIGSRENVPTLALRADMDALPVQEKVDVPYASRNDGVMHACGHDSHTAILLTAAKILKDQEDKLPCNLRLFFQPSEEGADSGAKMMVDNGCMEGVDAAVCLHCEPTLKTGTIGYCAGNYQAACIPVTLRFHGITSHATLPQFGVDAVAMAVESYGRLKEMVKQEAGDRPYIWSVGHFAGGDVHNVIPDLCTQYISFRYYDSDFAKHVMVKAEEICNEIAERFGGRAELEWHVSTGPVYNHPAIVEQFVDTMQKADFAALEQVESRKSSEDFGWYLTKAPGMLFRYGTGNAAKGCTATAHRPDFKIDLDAMQYGVLAFVNFALNYYANNF